MQSRRRVGNPTDPAMSRSANFAAALNAIRFRRPMGRPHEAHSAMLPAGSGAMKSRGADQTPRRECGVCGAIRLLRTASFGRIHVAQRRGLQPLIFCKATLGRGVPFRLPPPPAAGSAASLAIQWAIFLASVLVDVTPCQRRRQRGGAQLQRTLSIPSPSMYWLCIWSRTDADINNATRRTVLRPHQG